LIEKSGLIFLLIRAGFMGYAGLIFLTNRADFLNFTVTFSRESVTIFLAGCYYFLQNLLLFSRLDVTIFCKICYSFLGWMLLFYWTAVLCLTSRYIGKACKAQVGRRPMPVGLTTQPNAEGAKRPPRWVYGIHHVFAL
jgi:hypothetical protein